MMCFSPTTRWLLFLLVSGCVLLQACAASEKPKPTPKIGMHVDAVLKFVMEYPLTWNKDRRLASGSKEGELRWAQPGHPATLLRVKSSLQRQPALDAELQIDQALQEYLGLNVLSRQKVTLPAGEAWYVTGQTAQIHLDLYLLLHKNRSYLITFTSAAEETDDYQEVLERVAESFQIMP